MGKYFDGLAPFEQAAVFIHVRRELASEERGSLLSSILPRRADYLATATEVVAANPQAVQQVVMGHRNWIKTEGIDEQESFERVRHQIEMMTGDRKPDGRST